MAQGLPNRASGVSFCVFSSSVSGSFDQLYIGLLRSFAGFEETADPPPFSCGFASVKAVTGDSWRLSGRGLWIDGRVVIFENAADVQWWSGKSGGGSMDVDPYT